MPPARTLLSRSRQWRNRRRVRRLASVRTIYNYFRAYDPALSRFVQADPIGLKSGINPYLYGRANTLRWIDPFGLAECDIEGANQAEAKRSEIAELLAKARAKDKIDYDEVDDLIQRIEFYREQYLKAMGQSGKKEWLPPAPKLPAIDNPKPGDKPPEEITVPLPTFDPDKL